MPSSLTCARTPTGLSFSRSMSCATVVTPARLTVSVVTPSVMTNPPAASMPAPFRSALNAVNGVIRGSSGSPVTSGVGA